VVYRQQDILVITLKKYPTWWSFWIIIQITRPSHLTCYFLLRNWNFASGHRFQYSGFHPIYSFLLTTGLPSPGTIQTAQAALFASKGLSTPTTCSDSAPSCALSQESKWISSLAIVKSPYPSHPLSSSPVHTLSSNSQKSPFSSATFSSLSSNPSTITKFTLSSLIPRPPSST